MADPATIAAVGGAVLSFFGSRNANKAQNQYIDNKYELDTKTWKHNIQQGIDAWTFATEGVHIQQYNDSIQREWQNQTRIDEWIDRDKMRIFDYNNQVDTYNASIERRDRQLDYNQKAQQIALNDNTRKYNETLVKIGFQNEDMAMQLGFDTRNMLAQIQGKRAGAAIKAQQAKIEGIRAMGKARASGQTGRSAMRNMQSVQAEIGRTQYAIIDAITRDESAFGFNLEKAHRTYEFGQRQLQESLKSARGQYAADEQQISLKKWEADMAAQDRVAPEPQMTPELSKPREMPARVYQFPKHPLGEDMEKWPDIMDLAPVRGAKADTTFGPLVSAINTGLSIYGKTPSDWR